MLDTSPTYLKFLIVPCYYIICFECLMGFTKHFYIIFVTNLLTKGPVQIAVFLPISLFRRKGISNGMKPSGELFLEQTRSTGLGVDVKKEARRPRGREARLPPWARPHPRGCLGTLLAHLRYSVGSFGPKIISVKFQVNWTPFGIPFL